MFNLNTKLTVDMSGVDQSIAMASFSDDRTAKFDGTATGNQLEVKYQKALNAIFVYVVNASPVDVTDLNVTGTNPDGSAITISNLVDDTKGLTQSGFIYWSVETNTNLTVNAGDIFTYVFEPNGDLGADTELGGLNLLFCDKFDLLREYPDLNNLLELENDAAIDTKLIRIMEATRNDIAANLSNSPIRKRDSQFNLVDVELNRWDLLQIDEVKTAAVYLTLAKLFSFASDNPGDIYSLKASNYRAKGESLFESTNLSIDFNDNGSLDIYEGEREYDNIEITLER